MKILVCGLNYWPELIGVGKYTGELAEWLSGNGHEIRVVTAYPYYPAWKVAGGYRAAWYGHERHAGVEVYRCPVWVPGRPNGARRILHLLSFAASNAPVLAWIGLTWRPDVVFGIAPTLLSAPATLVASWLAAARSWLHVQDFEIDAAFAVGLLKHGLLRRMAEWMEGTLMRRFHRVSVISPHMREALLAKGIAAHRVKLLPNWFGSADIYPLERPSPMRQELGIDPSTIVALYSGNMNEKQGLEALAVAARQLQDRSGILFVFAGDGPARPRLERLSAGLANVRLLPLQSAERLNDLLNLADIHLLPQRAGTGHALMPSKMIGMMASGRPLVAGADPASTVAELAACCGLVVPAEDGQAMAEAILSLSADMALRGRLGSAGRQQALALVSKEAVLLQLERWFQEIVAPAGGEGTSAIVPTR